jgi:hypothetical protein
MVAAWIALTAASTIDRSRVLIGVVWRTRLRKFLCNCAAVDFCSCRDLLRLIQRQKRSISCALADSLLDAARPINLDPIALATEAQCSSACVRSFLSGSKYRWRRDVGAGRWQHRAKQNLEHLLETPPPMLDASHAACESRPGLSIKRGVNIHRPIPFLFRWALASR